MRNLTVEDKITSKNFYRNYFRRVVTLTFFSLLLMNGLIVSVFYMRVTRPAPDYYATNSAGFITRLTPMLQPNMSSTALLPPDPPEEAQIKELTL